MSGENRSRLSDFMKLTVEDKAQMAKLGQCLSDQINLERKRGVETSRFMDTLLGKPLEYRLQKTIISLAIEGLLRQR